MRESTKGNQRVNRTIIIKFNDSQSVYFSFVSMEIIIYFHFVLRWLSIINDLVIRCRTWREALSWRLGCQMGTNGDYYTWIIINWNDCCVTLVLAWKEFRIGVQNHVIFCQGSEWTISWQFSVCKQCSALLFMHSKINFSKLALLSWFFKMVN